MQQERRRKEGSKKVLTRSLHFRRDISPLRTRAAFKNCESRKPKRRKMDRFSAYRCVHLVFQISFMFRHESNTQRYRSIYIYILHIEEEKEREREREKERERERERKTLIVVGSGDDARWRRARGK